MFQRHLAIAYDDSENSIEFLKFYWTAIAGSGNEFSIENSKAAKVVNLTLKTTLQFRIDGR